MKTLQDSFSHTFLLTIVVLWSSTSVLAQTIINGSMTGTAGNTAVPSGWTRINGYSGGTSAVAPTPDILSTTFSGPDGTSTLPATVSPDGGTWVGLSDFQSSGSSENEAIRQTINNLTVGKVYKIKYYVANFGWGAVGGYFYNAGRVSAYIDGTKIATSSLRPVSSGWEEVSGTFTATNTSAVIMLDADYLNPVYMSVDGFSITEASPVPPVPTGTNPTSPGTSTGSVSLNPSSGSYPANTPVSVTYTNPSGTTVTYTGTSNGSGQIVIPNLPAGTYNNFKVAFNGGPASSPSGPVTLTDPAPACAADAGIIIRQ